MRCLLVSAKPDPHPVFRLHVAKRKRLCQVPHKYFLPFAFSNWERVTSSVSHYSEPAITKLSLKLRLDTRKYAAQLRHFVMHHLHFGLQALGSIF